MFKYFSPTKTAVSVFIFLTVSIFCHAEVITLLSGKTVEGKIISRNEEMIRVETSFGIPVTYYFDEIMSLDGKPISLTVEEGFPSKPINVPESTKIMEPPKPQLPLTKNMSPVTEVPIFQETVPAIKIKPVEKVTSRDAATLEDINLFQPSPPSPAAIKPSEAPLRVTDVINTTVPRGPAPTTQRNTLSEKIHEYTGDWQAKISTLKEELYAIPVDVRRDILIFTSAFFTMLYIVTCYPLMKIAQKFGKRHPWFIWLPIIQIFYFIYMANKPMGWIIFFLIPIVNLFMPLVLFVDILRSLKKPFFLIFLLILPGVNIFMLWYLAISRGTEC